MVDYIIAHTSNLNIIYYLINKPEVKVSPADIIIHTRDVKIMTHVMNVYEFSRDDIYTALYVCANPRYMPIARLIINKCNLPIIDLQYVYNKLCRVAKGRSYMPHLLKKINK